MLKDKDLNKLKSLLEEQYSWPSIYLFKFIVPYNQTTKVEALFPGHEISKKGSQKGNYVSLSIEIQLDSADHVIAIYQQASNIPGLISL